MIHCSHSLRTSGPHQLPSPGMDRNNFERGYDPLWFEKTIIPLFYKCTLILGLILPILYLLISLLGVSVDINFKGRNWILGFIAFLTAIIDLCSFTQPFNLARPVYVCFYPIRGETFHHPEVRAVLSCPVLSFSFAFAFLVYTVCVGVGVARFKSLCGVSVFLLTFSIQYHSSLSMSLSLSLSGERLNAVGW